MKLRIARFEDPRPDKQLHMCTTCQRLGYWSDPPGWSYYGDGDEVTAKFCSDDCAKTWAKAHKVQLKRVPEF